MSLFKANLLTGLAALAASLHAGAQPPHASPALPEAQGYRSAFEGYRPFQAGEVQDWRGANDTVRDIGGWRAYAREIQAGNKEAGLPQGRGRPAGQPPGAPAGAAAPRSQGPSQRVDPHAGHGR